MSLLETRAISKSAELLHRTRDELYQPRTWRNTFWQFLRYCLVGGANTATDLLVLNILLWRFPPNNVQLLVIFNSAAYTSGAVSSFFLNKYWTFGRTQKATRGEVLRFIISLCLEVLYSNGLIWIAGAVLRPLISNPTLWGNASKLVAVAFGTIISYSFMRFWTFASATQHHPSKQEVQTAEGLRNPPVSNETQCTHHSESE